MDLFQGTTTANDLIASVGSSVSSTLDSLYPVIGVVAGLALAIMLVPRIVSWFKQAGGRSRAY